jgi:ABC-type nickel/cobalt efflux system permease component RcnA
MIIIGLVLLIAAAVFGLDLIWKNQYAMRSPALFGQTLGIHNAAVYFVVGAITGAVLLLGIALMVAGLRRKGTKARQHRAVRKEAQSAGRERDKAQEENERLRGQLDQDHDHDHDDDAHSPGATAAS